MRRSGTGTRVGFGFSAGMSYGDGAGMWAFSGGGYGYNYNYKSDWGSRSGYGKGRLWLGFEGETYAKGPDEVWRKL